MSGLNRRDFLKVAGVTSAVGVTACDPKVPVEHILPYVVTPDEIVPGLPTFFASACDGCAAACGTVGRSREGRLVFVGGNTDDPRSRGGLCALGTASLQDVYDPDRLTGPSGSARGKKWAAIATDVAQKLVDARDGGKRIVWLGRYRSGSLGRLLGEVTGALGAERVHWEPLGYESLATATELAFGARKLPRYTLDDAYTIVTFGADFLHTWLSPVEQAAGWAQARDPHHGGFVAHTYAIQSRLGASGSRADTWWATRPGTELHAALALAKLLAAKVAVVPAGAAAFLAGVDAARAAQAAGVPLEKLQKLADTLVAHPSVVLPGGAEAQTEHGTDLALATLVINTLLGNLGRSVHVAAGHDFGPIHGFDKVRGVLDDALAGKIEVLVIDGLDLGHALPATIDVQNALAKVPTLVVFSNHMLEKVPTDAWWLPPGTVAETWGDAHVVPGHHNLQQAVMTPVRDTRGVGDVLLGIAQAAKLGAPPVVEGATEEPVAAPASTVLNGKAATPAFDAADFQRYVAGHWYTDLYPLAGTSSSFQTWWAECLQRGGYFPGASVTEPALADALPTPADAQPITAALFVFAHTLLRDGRGANKAWMQEIPDPLAGFAWSTWVEVSPGRAESMGLTEKDKVQVTTPAGTLEAHVRISKGMRDDAMAVAAGNGHIEGNRYSKGRGANAFKLLAPAVDARSGALSTVVSGATVEWTGYRALPQQHHQLKGSEHQDGRAIAAGAWVGDLSGHDAAPGSAVRGLLKIPEDPRLVAADLHDMYPEPEHPTYRWGMAIDIDRCIGCGACEAACAAENNIPSVGPEQMLKKRYMNWIRLNRFWEGEGEHPDVRYMPAICQHCSHAPCEGVCPVLATYHNLDGLNAMIYNRCVGTRYCANNCPYSARRFNYHTFRWPEAYQMMLNPDVSTREMGVMEKCTFCIQRIRATKMEYRLQDHATVPSNAVERLTACAEVCPTHAITFGNLKEAGSKVSAQAADARSYVLLGELNTKPGVRYLARITHLEPVDDHHGAHAGGSHSDGAHGAHDAGPAGADHGGHDSEHSKTGGHP